MRKFKQNVEPIERCLEGGHGLGGKGGLVELRHGSVEAQGL